jgi:hypothetical protein
VPALVLDEKAADWADAKEVKLGPPQQGRHKVTIPAGAPWAMFLYPPPERATTALSPASTPQPLSPWANQDVKQGTLVLKWRKASATSYEVQIARELMFRESDVIYTKADVKTTELKAPVVKLDANQRYHWRVRAIAPDGTSSGWSRPQSFWFEAATPPAAPPAPEAPVMEVVVPRPEKPAVNVSAFAGAGNLALQATTFSHPNYWEGAAEAVDGNAASSWIPDGLHGGEGRKLELPGWWAARFDKDETLKQVDILWMTDKPAKDFVVQTWDGKNWQDRKAVAGNTEAKTTVALEAPVTTKAVRIRITAAVAETTGIAEIAIR